MTNTRSPYEVSNSISGMVLGVYPGATDEACRDAGYKSRGHYEATTGGTSSLLATPMASGVRLFIVEEGEATEINNTVDANGTDGVLALATDADAALDLAAQYDAGRIQPDNEVWLGRTIVALRAHAA